MPQFLRTELQLVHLQQQIATNCNEFAANCSAKPATARVKFHRSTALQTPANRPESE
jgi:hypothetical protein